MKPIYIFDLDGTLALIEHRLHFISGDKKRWLEFFKACVYDKPNLPVINALKTLRRGGAEIWVWTGRSKEVISETEQWLFDNGIFKSVPLLNWQPFKYPETLMMRDIGDHTNDDVLKMRWLAYLDPPERNRIAGVFEDRDRVVQMWRDNGVPCFQVAKGNF